MSKAHFEQDTDCFINNILNYIKDIDISNAQKFFEKCVSVSKIKFFLLFSWLKFYDWCLLNFANQVVTIILFSIIAAIFPFICLVCHLPLRFVVLSARSQNLTPIYRHPYYQISFSLKASSVNNSSLRLVCCFIVLIESRMVLIVGSEITCN